MNAGVTGREVLAVKYGHRVTTRAESYLNFHLYGEPDADLDIDYYFWVVRDGGGVVLVDTGFAPEAGDRRRRAHYGTPAQALPLLGIDPDDVTAIVITHAHWDHTGNVREFPRAELVMTEAEYAFWTSSLAGRAQFAAHCEPEEIALLRQARADGRLTLFTGERAVAPGIELAEVGGHTPGQLIALVGTGTAAPSSSPPMPCTSTRRSSETARSRSSPTSRACTAPTTRWPSWPPSRARTWSPATTRWSAPASPVTRWPAPRSARPRTRTRSR